MQGNRDGSWFSSANGDGRSGSSGSSRFRPLAPPPPPPLSRFGVQQQSNIYPAFPFPTSFHQPNGGRFSGFSFAGRNFQGQQNMRIHPQIPTFPPQQFVRGNVFHQSHGQRLSFPPQPPLSFARNDLRNGNSSLKRRRQEEVKRTDAAVNEAHEATAAVVETTQSVRVSEPLSNDVVNDDGGGSQVRERKGSSEKSFTKSKRKGKVKRLDNAVSEARKAMVAAGENVSSATVLQSVLLEFQADSWRSLGVKMQDIPSLCQLMAIEGKINAFIHCFVGARRIVTLHDLKVAICRSEFVECFDDLDLGPLLQHPLIVLYFPSLPAATTQVEISSEDIISLLGNFLDIHESEDPIELDEFLDFVAKKKSATNKESLGVRIQSLGKFVSFIRAAKRQERKTLKILSKKQQDDDKSLIVTERLESSSSRQKEFSGKHIRFDSCSSDEGYDTPHTEKADSSCPYPSVAEEHTPIEITETDVTDGNNKCSKSTLQVSPNLLRPGNSVQESGNFSSSDFNERDQPHTSLPWATQAIQTGKLGETIAYRYFTKKLGREGLVTWVNEHGETGLPYDIVVERGGKKEYIEVKATVSSRKDWFNLSVWEWEFGCDKGDSYIVAHVLVGNANALLTQHRNPVKLCQEGKLRLLIVMPKQRNEVSLPTS